jgi:hypothetical protein
MTKQNFPKVESNLPKEIPKGFNLASDGWLFTKAELEETLEDGSRPLLTLDLSIAPDYYVKKVREGDDEGLSERAKKFYPCPNKCTYCFDYADVSRGILSWKDIEKVLLDAKELGLKSAKFLAVGEFFINPSMFEILDFMQEQDIKFSIFTKGEVLGNDNLANRIHGMSSEELVRRVCEYDITRFLMDGWSFVPDIINERVGRPGSSFFDSRNRAIELLVENGMNDPMLQRMTLQTNPVMPENIGEVYDIFVWGAERSIPVCVTKSMVAGKGVCLGRAGEDKFFDEQYVDLAVQIYSYLIERGITSLERVREEGVSSYVGTRPCNQLTCGLFIDKDGTVRQCPGNSLMPSFADDVRTTPLDKIWVPGNPNYEFGSQYNNHCMKDGYSIPFRFYSEVQSRLEEKK